MNYIQERILKKLPNVDKKDDEPMKYKYTIKKGITQVNGGIEVLKQMNYPTEIMDTLNIL